MKQKVIEIPSDPCSNCYDYPMCKNTCEKAAKWWEKFAKLYGGKKV